MDLRCSLTLVIIILMCPIAQGQVCSPCNSSGWVSTLQVGQVQTYSVPPLPGSSIVWVVTGNLIIVAGQGTPTVSVRATSAGRGSIFVTRFKEGHSACADFLRININGPPPAPDNLDIIIEPCETVLVRVNPLVNGATGYNFYLNGELKQSSALSDFYISLVIPEIQPGTHSVCVSAFNSNGSSGLYCETFEITCVGGAGRSFMKQSEVFPVPTNSVLRFSEKVSEVIILDGTGKQLHRLKPDQNSVDLSVLSLIEGTYIIRIVNEEGKTTMRRFTVQK